MAKALARKSARDPSARPVSATYRIADYPMHYFAAIQRQNQINLGHSLRKHGLSVPMWRALSALHDRDGQTIGQIERENLPDDRRAVLIRLSATGKKLFANTLPSVLEHYRHLLHGLSDVDFKTLMRLLRRIKANVRMMSDVASLAAD
jgi:MarR family transcriptional regulator, organic hydroperoxide resistance regulator